MEQITIEGILDQPLIQLVKNAPSNPITRGQIRAATNLVIPDGVITTEGITQYVLENYDASKAPSKPMLRIGRHRDRGDVIFSDTFSGNETRYFRTTESLVAYMEEDVTFTEADFDDCHTKEDVLIAIQRKINDEVSTGNVVDEAHHETIDRELDDSDHFECEYDLEEIWSEHGEAIAASLGLDIEEME